MTCEANEGSPFSVGRPKVVGGPKPQMFHVKPRRRQPLPDNPLTPRILRRHARASKQLKKQIKDVVHRFPYGAKRRVAVATATRRFSGRRFRIRRAETLRVAV